MAGAIRLPIAAEETRRSRSVTEVMHDLDDDDVGGGNGGGNGGGTAAPSFNFEPRVSTLSVGTGMLHRCLCLCVCVCAFPEARSGVFIGGCGVGES